MRFVIYGAGGIGLLAAARLHQHGFETLSICRKHNHEHISSGGLTIATGDQRETIQLPTAPTLTRQQTRPDDIIILTVKAHQTQQAVDELANLYSAQTPVFSLQNGIDNLSIIQKTFPRAIGSVVLVFGLNLAPGYIDSGCWANPTGYLELLDFAGTNRPFARLIKETFITADFPTIISTAPKSSAMAKLLLNLCNAIAAITDEKARPALCDLVINEACTILDAHQLAYERPQELLERFTQATAKPFQFSLADGTPYLGSTWQSLQHQLGHVETVEFNGYITELAKQCGLSAPINHLLLQTCLEMAEKRQKPGLMTQDQLWMLCHELSSKP